MNNSSDSQLMLELVGARLFESVIQEIGKEKDERTALRKALLALMMMTQGNASPALSRFIEHLVTEFQPLAGYFSVAHNHPLFAKHQIGRRRTQNGKKVELCLNRGLFEFMLKKPLDQDEVARFTHLLPWELTTDRYVAFYDIMGFRAFIEQNGQNHRATYDIMRALNDAIQEAQRMHTLKQSGRHSEIDRSGSQLRFVQFSDSILVLTRDASVSSAMLITLASFLIFCDTLRLRIPIRGAIAKGPITADFSNSIFFGQPIIDAYLLEEDQAWYGIVEHESVNREEPDANLPSMTSSHIPLTVPYNVPRKSVKAVEMQTINWPCLFHDTRTLDSHLSHLRNTRSKKLNAYYRNTKEFALKMMGQFK